MTTKYRAKASLGLFETEQTKIELSSMGNPLKDLSQSIDFEMLG